MSRKGKEPDKQEVLIDFALILDKHTACDIVTPQETAPFLTVLNANIGAVGTAGHLAQCHFIQTRRQHGTARSLLFQIALKFLVRIVQRNPRRMLFT